MFDLVLQESGEMYLETIYILSLKKEKVRAVDVGEYMGFSKPSVSRAVSLLKAAELVSTDKDGFLLLTESGKAIAEKTYDRHITLADFFMRLGVPEDVATVDACKIEHDISDITFAVLKEHAENYNKGEKTYDAGNEL